MSDLHSSSLSSVLTVDISKTEGKLSAKVDVICWNVSRQLVIGLNVEYKCTLLPINHSF